jgi:hypothetical protein
MKDYKTGRLFSFWLSAGQEFPFAVVGAVTQSPLLPFDRKQQRSNTQAKVRGRHPNNGGE